MPRAPATKTAPKVKKTPGRKPRGATHRLEVRRVKASTSLRITDKTLALFEKVAAKWDKPLPEAFEAMVEREARRSKVSVAPNSSNPLGWA